MAAIIFPTSPTLNQEFTAGDRTWVWDGTVWDAVDAVIVGPTGATGPAGVTADPSAPVDTTVLWLDTDEVGSNIPVPSGGSAGQVLAKATNTDYDSAWIDRTGSGNAVINGGFDIWQRGLSFTAQQYTVYGADRWCTYRGAGSLTQVSRQATNDTTNLPNIQYAARVGRSSTDSALDAIFFSQSFETVNSIPLAGKTVTLSFYARKGSGFSSATGLGVRLKSGTGVDQNELALYTGQVYVNNSNFVLTTTFQRFTVSATIPTNATEVGLDLGYTPVGSNVSSDYFEITGVQLEAGSTATPFRRNGGSIQAELAACQRYYQRFTSEVSSILVGGGIASSTTNVQFLFSALTQMRTRPTSIDYAANMRAYDLSGAPAITGIGLSTTSPQTLGISCASSGLTQFRPYILIAQDAQVGFIGFSAEL